MFRPPTRIAPAASSLRTRAPWRLALGPSTLIFEPARVASPSMSNRFLTANGTPISGPRWRPASISAARLRARSATRSVKALTVGSAAAIRLRAASMTALALALPLMTARAISLAVAAFDRGSLTGAPSRPIDRQGRQLVVEREREQRSRDRQRPLDVDDDFLAILGRDRQANRLGALVDPARNVRFVVSHVSPSLRIWRGRKEYANERPMTIDLGVHTLGAAYRAGTLTVRQVIDEVLKRIAVAGDDKVWISRVADQALRAQADALDPHGDRSLPLFGIPFAVKDNIDVAGLPTTAACPGFAYRPTESAEVVKQLVEAGAIVIGKTNLDQFAT